MEAARRLVTEETREEVLLSLIHPRDEPENNPEEALDDPALPPPPIIGNTADVAYQLRQIGEIMEEIDKFKTQAEEARFFYERRIEALEFRAEFLKENIGHWLKANNMKRLATHTGTIYFSKRTRITLPDDDSLVKWIGAEDPERALGLLIEKPNKSEVKKYIESTGHVPDGYHTEVVEAISIRKVA